MTQYASLDDLLEQDPTIQDYGILDWDAELIKSSNEINRVLKVRWYQAYQKRFPSIINVEFDPNKLLASQFTQATVYHALAYHICPKLTQFSGGEPDKFQQMMQYYQGRFEHEMDLILREGVQYDLDGDSTYEATERKPVNALRLTR